MSPEEMENCSAASHTPFSDFFSTFFGGGGERRRARAAAREPRDRAAGQDVEAEAELTLEEAFSGTTRRVVLPRHGKDHAVDVRIPAGVKDGARVRAAGEGGRSGGDGPGRRSLPGGPRPAPPAVRAPGTGSARAMRVCP